VFACGGSTSNNDPRSSTAANSTGGPSTSSDPGAGKGGSRTVTGTFSTIYQKDDGSRTSVAGLNPNQPTPDAIVFSNGNGYTSVPLTVAPDGTFSVPDIPGGTYYLQTEQVQFSLNALAPVFEGVQINLIPLTSDTPDLSTVVHGRADAAPITRPSPVTLNVTGLEPWSNASPFRGQFYAVTPQAQGDESVFLTPPLPAPGITSLSVTFDWQENVFDGFTRLPDASKGDVTYFIQRNTQPMSGGCGGAVTKRFARSTTFTVPDGGGITAPVDLQPVSLTNSIATAASFSKFATLVPSINPQALLLPDPAGLTSPEAGASLFAVPGSLSYPDFTGLGVVPRMAAYAYPSTTADTDCGTLAYGGILDPPFQTMRNFAYLAGVILDADGTDIGLNPIIGAQEDASKVSNAIEPKLGPVASPRINGKDAFQAQTGVGQTPTLSWSQPKIGSASDYTVNIQMLSGPDTESDVIQIVAGVHGGNSFTLPAGLLKAGKTYVATITAVDESSHDPNRPLRSGLPIYTADAVTNTFTP
jgi:hypothetical protein